MAIKKFLSSFFQILSLLIPVVMGLLLTAGLAWSMPAQAQVTTGEQRAPLAELITATETITTSPEILHLYDSTHRPPRYIPPAVQGATTANQPLNCNPSGGAGGLGLGTHDTTIAGQPATVIVGQGYDPAKPTYLAFYLHGDEGGYNFHTNPFNLINQFINDNSWIYVAPQAPKALDGDYYPWDGRGGGSIAANETLVKAVLEHMFANYNVCRNILFGASVSGGSWFYDIYFYPNNGAQYPAFMNLVCGSGGVSAASNFFGSYDKLVDLSGNADVKARSEFKYTIGDGDFMYDNALNSVATYSGLGFSVITDYLPGVSHCLNGAGVSSSEKIRDYWQAKFSTLNTFTLDKTLLTTGLISPSTRLTYSLTIFNGGDQAATNLTLGDSFPGQLAYVAGSAAATPAIIDLTNFPTATAPFTLETKSSVLITYSLQVTGTAATGDKLSNTAAISAPTFSKIITDSVTITVGATNNYVYLPLLVKN